MDTMQGLKRTHYCGDVEGIGNEVVVGGYVQKVRDLGNLIFIDLRDRTGIVQLALMIRQTEKYLKKRLIATANMYLWQKVLFVKEKARIQQLKQVILKLT